MIQKTKKIKKSELLIYSRENVEPRAKTRGIL